MKTITDDPKEFFETGGWTFLDPESGDEGEANDDEESEEDEAYEPTDIESEEESDDDSEYSEASEDDSDESEEGTRPFVAPKNNKNKMSKMYIRLDRSGLRRGKWKGLVRFGTRSGRGG